MLFQHTVELYVGICVQREDVLKMLKTLLNNENKHSFYQLRYFEKTFVFIFNE